MSKPAAKTANKEPPKEEKKVEVPADYRGYGKFEFQNKIIYQGQYYQKNGVKYRDGKGKITHPTFDNTDVGKEIYEGDWIEDQMTGYGVYIYSNGDRYEGQFLNNQHNGLGKYYFTDGSKYDGEWKDHKMHGSGKYWDINGVLWAGEFREGSYISKEQAKLKEEKRIKMRIKKLSESPNEFYKKWEEIIVKVDKKNAKEMLGPFFATVETMGLYVKEPYPKLEDRAPDKWNDAFKFLFSNKPIINVIKGAADLVFIDKGVVLTPQLQEEINTGQIIEINTVVDLRKVFLGIAFNRDSNRWVIIYFNEIIEKKK
jgi:hypothetical protein